MVKSRTGALVKFLVDKIKPIEAIICHHNVGDLFQFAKNMREINIKGTKLASLDVVSQYTNVQIEETIKIILNTIRNKKLNIGLSLNDLEQLFLLCFADVQFLCNENYYTQVYDVAMLNIFLFINYCQKLTSL